MNNSVGQENPWTKNQSFSDPVFAIDVRSLAALRIGLAIIILVELALRLSTITLLYSDAGILTGPESGDLSGTGAWSLYWLNGSPWFSQVLILMTAVAAVGMLFGFETKWMTAICLVLVSSLEVRNPLVAAAGETLLRLMLFWMLFLPTAEVWSIDSLSRRYSERRRWSTQSVASAAILVQLACMYFFSGLAKLNEQWISGHGLQHHLGLESHARPLSDGLIEYPGLLHAVTYAVLIAELAGPILLFLPRLHSFLRGLLMGVFWCWHLLMWLTFSGGMISAVAICSWVLFVPSDIWNGLIGEPVGFKKKTSSRANKSLQHRFGSAIAGIFLACVLIQNVFNASGISNSVLDVSGKATMTIQNFARLNRPPVSSPWFEYLGELEDGYSVELFSQVQAEPGKKPVSVYKHLGSRYWREVHRNLVGRVDDPEQSDTYFAIRRRLLKKFVEQWNDVHEEKPVHKAVLICHLEPIRRGEQNPDTNEALRLADYDIADEEDRKVR